MTHSRRSHSALQRPFSLNLNDPMRSKTAKILPYLGVAFLSHYAGLVGGYFLATKGGQFSPEDGYNTFELAVAFGPLISLFFVLLLLGVSLFRIKELSIATQARRFAGAVLAAGLALLFEISIDLRLATLIDEHVSPIWLGDWLAPVLVVSLMFAACYVGVRFAVNGPTSMATPT